MNFSSSVISPFKNLLALIQHPVTYDDLKELMKAKDFQEAFPLFARGNLNALLVENAPEQFLAAGIQQGTTWQLLDTADSELRARKTLAEFPHLRISIRERIPWQGGNSCREKEGLLRDLRNAFYAGEDPEVRNFLSLQQKYLGLPIVREESFAFLLTSPEGTWIDRLALPLQDLAATFLPSLLAANLQELPAWEKRWLKRKNSLPEAAQVSLADMLLLRGNLEEAENILNRKSRKHAEAPSAAIRLRLATLAWFQNRKDEAITCFDALMTETRTNLRQPRFTFSALPGLFYLFALLQKGQKDATALDQAKEMVRLATDARHPFWHPGYVFLNQVLNGIHGNEAASVSRLFPLTAFFQFLASSWQEETTCAQLETAAGAIIRQASPCYTWVLREIRNLMAHMQNQMPDTITLEGIPSIYNSIHTPLKWERAMQQLNQIASEPETLLRHRIAWFLSMDEDPCCPLLLRPMEQRASRPDRWGKGHFFSFSHYGESTPWPEYCTPIDILLFALLKDPSRTTALPGNRYRCPEALQLLPGHSRLFWESNPKSPVACEKTSPRLHIRQTIAQESDTLSTPSVTLEVTPPPAPDFAPVPIRPPQGNLQIFFFSESHRKLTLALRENPIVLPLDQFSMLQPLLPPLSQAFPILSELPLPHLGIPSRPADSRLHIRLEPHEHTMRVTIFLIPFPEQSQMYAPATGPLDCLMYQDDRLVCLHRNFETEKEKRETLLSQCKILAETPSQEGCIWELQSLEDCCQFTLFLQEQGDTYRIHWPEREKIRISRRLTINDMSVNCHSIREWLAIDGTVTVDENLVVSLKEVFRAAKNQPGHFIQLESGQLLALSESFRRRLDDLTAVIQEQDDGTFLCQPFSMPYLQSLLPDSEELQERLKIIDQTMTESPEVPATLQATLRPYQVEGYLWLSRLYSWQGTGACLADDMGLGKTLQTIALLLAKAHLGPSLVVAPTSVCENWREECARFAPSLKVLVFGGQHREQTLRAAAKPGHLIICSYGLLQSEEEMFRRIDWNIAVLDEAQAIKNHHTKRSKAAVQLHARFRMVTTGTPLENNLNELWSIFHFLTPGLLGTRETFTVSFAGPIERNNDHNALTRLSNIVRPFILRRRKSSVLPDLPAKTEIRMEIDLSAEERAMYEALRQSLVEEIRAKNLGAQQLRVKVITAITKLRLAACHPQLIQSGTAIESSKLHAFLELLDSILSAGHKCLVFSQFVKHLAILRRILEERGIPYQYLDGSTRERAHVVDDFQKHGKSSVFLISLKAGGVGLNLTEADYVIMMDPWWNPAIEDQASDRAHRIGQKKPVTVYRLIAKNTIETRIINLHQQKRELADHILAGTDTISKVTTQELLQFLADS